MKDEIKEKQLKEVLYGLDYIGNKIKNDDGKLELGVNNCKLLLDYITNLQEENVVLKSQLLQDNKSYHDMQDRIKKAIEYINKSEYATIESYKHIHADNEGKVYNLDILLNILKGSDE